MSDQATSFLELYDALDLKEQAFVDEYMECLNAALAARRVYGHASAKQTGYKLLHRPDVKAAIDAGIREQNERTNNDPDRIIRQLMELAYADPRDLLDEQGELVPLHQLAPEVRRAVVSVKVLHEKVTTEESIGGVPVDKKVTTQTRAIQYTLAAKTPNLELLGKRLKMFTDRLELDASDNLASLIGKAFNRPKPAPAAETAE